MNILAGDIGGTKTILSIFSSESGLGKPLAESSFQSSHYDSLEKIIHEFKNASGLPFEKACFGVAGPVLSGRARITNLTWVIDAEVIKTQFQLKAVGLLNDLESVAYAIPILETKDVFTLNAGKPANHGNIGVVAPGTGLGEGFLTFEKDRYVAHASEGSHASFAPTNELQIGLLKYAWQKGHKHVSFERVCSGGLGVPLLYEYLKQLRVADEPDWLKEKISASEDPTPIIFNAAQDSEKPCQLAAATVSLFLDILGAEVGNLALKVLSTGGMYLGGGISPRILNELQLPAFLDAVRSKGRFKTLLSEMPIHVILNSKAGLLGAASQGFSLSG